jgi:hypothetical protein
VVPALVGPVAAAATRIERDKFRCRFPLAMCPLLGLALSLAMGSRSRNSFVAASWHGYDHLNQRKIRLSMASATAEAAEADKTLPLNKTRLQAG